MRNIFLCLLMNLKNHGKITAAKMENDELTKITLVSGEDTYKIKVTKVQNSK